MSETRIDLDQQVLDDTNITSDSLSAEREFAGNIEGVELDMVVGWVMDTHCSGAGVPVELYVKNQKVGTGTADIERDDLREAGFSSGAYGFRISVDPILFDGIKHKICVRLSKNVEILASEAILFEPFAVSTVTAIDAGVLNGHLALKEQCEQKSFVVELLVDNDVISTHVSNYDEKTKNYSYAIALPIGVFDDNLHVFSVRIKGVLTKQKPMVERLESVQTPWKYLNDCGSGSRLSAISKLSGYRYAALQAQLDRYSCDTSDLAKIQHLQMIKTAHDVLVEGYEGRTKYPKLVLPKEPTPQVSIVIPVHNKFELTYNCLASLILSHDMTSFEVIIVDDKSIDNTLVVDEIIENVKYIRNNENMGFLLSSCNGAEKARGEYIVFLNNDTEVTNGWLDALVESFETFDSVGMAGSKLIYPNGKLQEAGGIVWGSGKPWNIGNGDNAEHPKYNYTRQVDYLSGAAVMIAKDVWEKVEGFSREFAPAYYEDTDLAFKVRAAGYKTVYSPFSTVVHFEGMSNGRDTNAGIKRFQSVNAPVFRAKWRHSYRHNGQEGHRLAVEMDRGVDFRALVIDYTTPKPAQDAGGYAAVQEIKLLQELGCKVTFAPNNMAHLGRSTEALQKHGVECIYAPFYSGIDEFLQERGADYDLVYITRYDIAEQVIDTVRQHTDAKVIFNNADLHFLRELRAALANKEVSLDGPISTRERELQVMRRVDAVLSYNEVEHSVIASHNLLEENVFKCPWVLENKRSKIPYDKRDGIAFLGGFNHTPNREGVKYFVEEVMPLLRIAQPGIRFHIYGSKVTEDIEALASEDVIIEGYVDNLAKVFDTCRVFVAPLLSGAGIKGKVLESMAFGVPSVLTTIAAEATGLVHNHSTLIANSPIETSESIVQLYNDVDLWNSLATNSNELVHTHYGPEQGLEKMQEVLKYVELEPASHRQKLFSYVECYG